MDNGFQEKSFWFQWMESDGMCEDSMVIQTQRKKLPKGLMTLGF